MKIKAAVIGSGIGLKHLEAINQHGQANVKILYEKNKLKNRRLKKLFPNIKITNNENDIFNNKEINLVSIASYDDFHYKQITKCIKTKKNLIVEKPICLTINELKEIYSLLKKNPKIKFTSNLVLRCNDLFQKIKKKIKVKDLIYLEADYLWGRKHKLYQWRSKLKNYSIIHGAGIHMIDLVMWLLNQKPIYVKSFGNKIGTANSTFKKESFVFCILRFPKNILVKISINASGIHNHFHELRIFQKGKSIIHSTKGSYEILNRKSKIFYKNIKSNYPDKKNRKKLIHNFLDTFNNKNKKQLISLKEQIDLMSVCFAAENSLKNKKEVKIKYL